MKHTIFTLALLAASITAAHAVQAGADARYFGAVDPAEAGVPLVMYPQPYQAEGARTAGAKAVYLHVRPGDEARWGLNCKQYDACTTPVLFVRESWYRQVYLPKVGLDDGREQYYRDHMRVPRNERVTKQRAEEAPE